MKNSTLLIAAFLFVFTLLYGYPLIFGGQTLAGEDIVNGLIPVLSAFKEQLARGEFPFWNPWIFAGRPLQGDVHGYLSYPPNLLLWLLPLSFSFDLLLLLHCWFGAFGMALWMRPRVRHWLPACLSGMIFLFGGYATARLQLGHFFIINIAWLPWILWSWDRLRNSLEEESPRRGTDFALVTGAIALAVLSVGPQIAFYSMIVFFLYALFLHGSWREGLWFTGACALAAGICAVQIIPSALMADQSWDRSGQGAMWDYITDGSVEPRMLLTQLVPLFFGDQTKLPYWGQLGYGETMAYMGCAGLFLIVLFLIARPTLLKPAWMRGIPDGARRDTVRFELFLLLLIVLSALFIFGKRSPAFWLAYHLVPGFDRFRQPGRMLLFYSFGGAALAGWTLDRLMALRETMPARRAREYGAVTLVAALGLLAGTALWLSVMYWLKTPDTMHLFLGVFRKDPGAIQQLGRMSGIALTGTALFVLQWLLAGACLLCLLSSRTPRAALGAAFLLVTFCGADLLRVAWNFQISAPRETFGKIFYPESERVRFLRKELKGNERFLCLDTTLDFLRDKYQSELLTNRFVVLKLHSLRGYTPVNSRRFGLAMNQIAGIPLTANPRGQMFFPDKAVDWRLLSLWNVRIVFSYLPLNHPDLEEAARWTMSAGENSTLYAYRLKTTTAARLSNAVLAPPESTLEEQIAMMKNRSFRPETEALLTENPFEGMEEPAADAMTSGTASAASVREIPTGLAGVFAYETNSPARALLATAVSYYPGWKATVDGKPVRVLPANVAQCAVPVPPGKHRVEIRYRPPQFSQGLGFSIASLLLLGLLARRLQRESW